MSDDADAEDDWFERATREDDPDVTVDTADRPAVSEDDGGDDDPAGAGGAGSDGGAGADPEFDFDAPAGAGDGTPESGTDGDSGDGTGGRSGDGTGGPAPPGTDGTAPPGTDSGDGPGGGDGAGTGTDPQSGDDGDDGSLFEQDFASALNDTDVPSGAGGDAGGPEGSAGPGAGPGPGGGDPGGPGTAPGGPAGGAGGFGDLGGDEGLAGGAGDAGGLGGEEFDAEELDSEIDRIEIGIEGLDRMIHGGVPEQSLMVAIGSAGTGKTTFGLQFLDKELRDGGRGVFITLEESRERILDSATEKNLPFDRYAEEGRLAVVDIDPVEMANSLATIRSELPRLIEEFDANRLVLDSVSLLEMMYDERARRRNEIYDFTRSLKGAGVTTMLTSEAAPDSAYTSRYGIVEYLTDAVFVLQYVRPSDFRETRLAVEIQKIRDANHSRETKPYEITGEGISVYQQANIF